MSSSSENEEVSIPVKRVKRRHLHRVTGLAAEKQKVNLYSHKILPKLDALAKSPIKISKEDADEGDDYVPFFITPTKTTPEPPKSSVQQSPSLRTPMESTIDSPQDVPPTPPPPFEARKRTRKGGRAKKLLLEVSTVLSQVSHQDASNDSFVLVEETNDNVKELMVKIRLRGRLQRFPVKETSTFNEIFDTLAKKAKVDASRLLVTFGDRRIFPSDTPAGVQLTIADILECVVAHRRLAPDVKDTIKIQMQGPFQKKKVPFTMGRNEAFKTVMEEYAEKYKTDIKFLQFRFDGESLEPTATPKFLDLDNGDCIDVMQRSKR